MKIELDDAMVELYVTTVKDGLALAERVASGPITPEEAFKLMVRFAELTEQRDRIGEEIFKHIMASIGIDQDRIARCQQALNAQIERKHHVSRVVN